MVGTDLDRLKGRLAAARADVEGKASEQELEVALEEIQALWDELHEHADRLARERERNDVLFARAPFGCVLTDGHGLVRDANAAAVALLEVPHKYLLGKPLNIFVADEQRGAFRSALIQACDPARTPGGWSCALKSPSGQSREVHVDVRALPPHPGEPLQLIWFLRDLD